ncbi:MAG: ShlB/FhaC/HecB family hemolysin secretion/activation protein [Pararobbsia sp.]
MAGPNATEEQRLRERRDAETRAQELEAPDTHGGASGMRAAPGVVERFPALPAQTPCFAIDRFELAVPPSMPAAAQAAGASSLPQDPFAFAAEWLMHYNGQCVGNEALGVLTRGLTHEIFRRGYVTTRVRIPEQDLSTGALRIHLIPGRIHAIRFSDPALDASWRTAFPSRPGDTLKLPDIEQALVQFEQVPGQAADIQIVPSGEEGEDDVIVTLARDRPWRISAVVDNSGGYETGKVIGTLGVGVDNLLGLNDRLNAAFNHDLMFGDRAQGAYGWNASYALPAGYWTATLSGWGNHYYQRIQGHRASFVSTGESQAVEAQFARTLLRTRASTLGIQFRIGKRFGRSLIEDHEIASQRRNNTYVQFGLSERRYFGAARLDATLSYRQGVPWLGARRDPAGRQATYLYRMGLLDANLSVPFGVGKVPLLYTSAFHGQMSADKLFRIDDIALGTRWSVRGFDGEHILSAERGFYWRNDLAMPIGHRGHSVYVGVDYGQVAGPNARRLLGTRLAGAVVGVRGVAGSRGGASRAAAALPARASRDGTVRDAAGQNVARTSGQSGMPSPSGTSDVLVGAGQSELAGVSASAGLAGPSETGGTMDMPGMPGTSGNAPGPVAHRAVQDAPQPQWAADLASLSLPGVLTYDLYAGAPLWKPEGFPTASFTVGFQLAYLY